MSTRIISWVVKAAGALGWQPYLHLLIFLKYLSLNLLEPSGFVHPCNGNAIPFTPKLYLSLLLHHPSPLLPSWRCFLGKWIVRFCHLRFRSCSHLNISLVTEATVLGVWASARVFYASTLNEPTGSCNRYLPNQIMTLCNSARTIRCYWEGAPFVFL